MKRRLFRWRWGIRLNLPPEPRSYIEGDVLPWQVSHLRQLELALRHLPRKLIRAARVSYLFFARDLRDNGIVHEGVAYEFTDRPDPKWIGLNVSLFTSSLHETDLRVPMLFACLLEEMVHVWDFRLEAEGSPYSSAGSEWVRVECDANDDPNPFNIPNRKNYNLVAEDWASVIVWFVFQPDELRRISPERSEFVERLFRECLPP